MSQVCNAQSSVKFPLIKRDFHAPIQSLQLSQG